MDALRYGMDSFTNTGTFKMQTDVGGVKPFLPNTLA
jgi:hypothetical protein